MRKPIFTKTHYKVTKTVLIIGALITGLLSCIIGILAFFGQNLGTFVANVDNNSYLAGIILSDDKDFKGAYPRLLVNPLKNAFPVTYGDFEAEIETIKQTDGDYPNGSNNIIGYTFYLMNEGNAIGDVKKNIVINKKTNNVEKAIRIMLFETRLSPSGEELEEQVHIYEHLDLDENGEPEKKHPLDATPEELVTYFKDDSVVFENVIRDLRPGEVVKYTIIVWLEGWDAQCDEFNKGGQLKMAMNFEVISTKTEE